MGKFVIGKITKIFAWLIAGIIVILNARLVIEVISDWLHTSSHPLIIQLTVVPITIAAGVILLYITFRPFVKRILFKSIRSTHHAPPLGDITTPAKFSRIVIAIDFSTIDSEVIRYALSLAHPESKILIIHVVESAGAMVFGKETNDYEAIHDKNLLDQYQLKVQAKGIETSVFLGFGNPKNIIPEKVHEFNADLLLMGAHGHKGLKDIVFGTTVDNVSHKVNIPVLIVKGIK